MGYMELACPQILFPFSPLDFFFRGGYTAIAV
jgi:hypothetical protein